MLTIHDFDWRELDALLNYSISIIDKEIPLSFVNPKTIMEKGILPYTAAEIDLRLKAISDWNPELLLKGANQGKNEGSIYKQGSFINEFKKRGGFEEWHKKEILTVNEKKLREATETEANVATINAAEYAKRSAIASESSASSAKWAWIIAGIALLVSILSIILSLKK